MKSGSRLRGKIRQSVKDSDASATMNVLQNRAQTYNKKLTVSFTKIDGTPLSFWETPETGYTLRNETLCERLKTLALVERGEGGIRTLGSLLGYGALAKRCFRPLSHLTKIFYTNTLQLFFR